MARTPNQSILVFDHGYVKLLNIAGPTRRASAPFDASDTDPANAARMSFDQSNSDRTEDQDLKLCRYLYNNHHTTPFEMVQVWLEMKLPIFVARQFVRHRTVSINEISGRYVKLPTEWYLPEANNVGIKAATNKQGRDTTNIQPMREWFIKELDEDCTRSYDRYLLALEHGIPHELARLFLHVNHYTKWLWRQDLHNLFHFLSLRDHNHAQWEAQQYARVITKLLEDVLPETMQLYKESH